MEKVNAYWDEYLSSVQVETPDEQMNWLLNVWGKRQSWVTFNANRNAGYYHGGLLFGVGMRDQCQDMWGPLLSDPRAVEERLAEVITPVQDGSTLHNYFKLTGTGEKTGHSDTPLWIPLWVMNYVKETGDYAFLTRGIDFQDSGRADVLDHVTRAVDYVLSASSPKTTCPKFGPGDWNDTLDYVGRKGKGESVWVAHFLCYILRETAELLEYVCRTAHCTELKSILPGQPLDIAGNMTSYSSAVNGRCWDGEWYIRGIRDDGDVIGSSKNAEGKIFMNAQSWAVISGVAGPERGRQAMDSASKLCITLRGPKILSPSYTQLDEGIGLATRCVPGKKENGAIFNHVAAWSILANCLLGEGNRAYDWYRRTMPMVQASDPTCIRWSRMFMQSMSRATITRLSARQATHGSPARGSGCSGTGSTTSSASARTTTA